MYIIYACYLHTQETNLISLLLNIHIKHFVYMLSSDLELTY
jgi:hypothetical protein